MTEIPSLADIGAYERLGAYLSGDTLYRFVTNDGYYRTDLTTGESARIRDAQLTDSYAFHMTEKYIVETNLFYGFDPETPEIRIWDGTGWHSASLPDNIWPGKEAYFSPFAISTEHLFITIGEGMTTRLYCIRLTDETYTLTPCGEFELPQ